MTTIFPISKADGCIVAEKQPDTAALFWQEFNARFKTEEDCVEELYRKFGEFMRCRQCGSAELKRVYGARTAWCSRCHKTSWLTAGTFFDRIRSARPWLAAISLFEDHIIINTAQFHRLVGMSYSAARDLIEKVRTVLRSLMEEETIVVPSAQFADVICKRSRETPARQHPRSEEEQIQGQLTEREQEQKKDGVVEPNSVLLPSEVSGNIPLSESNFQPIPTSTIEVKAEEFEFLDQPTNEQRQVLELLSDQPVHFDVLCRDTRMSAGLLSASITMLELEGLLKAVPGGCYVRATRHPQSKSLPSSSPVNSLSELASSSIGAAIKFIRSKFGGISRKYLQNYLAVQWCQSRRSELTGWLFRECLRFGPITSGKLLAYVTPPEVRLWSVPNRQTFS